MADSNKLSPEKDESYRNRKITTNIRNVKFSKRFNNRQLKKRLIYVIIIVMTLIGIGYFNHKHVVHQDKLNHMAKISKSYNSIQRAKYYSEQGEYKLAESILDSEISKAKDVHSKIAIYIEQSNISISYKKYNDAKKYLDKVVALSPKSIETYSAQSYLALSQGDKVTARKYIQLAIDSVDENSPGYNMTIYDLKTSLDTIK